MADPTKTVNSFVREDNTTTIVCPSCDMIKIVSVASYKEKCHFLKVRCSCGGTFRVHLNFRQFYRKTTELAGTYRCIDPPGGGGGPMIVQDISRGGVGLRISGNHNLRKGYTLSLSFTLDDKKDTPLNKEVCIQSVHGNALGCRFSGHQAYEKELGFYMQG